MSWTKIEIDQVKTFCLFVVSKNEELKEAFRWENTQTLLKQDDHPKRTKYNFPDYHLQFIKAYQFLRFNDQEGLNQ